jgi:hypothetical protein
MTTTGKFKRFAVRCLDEARNASDEHKRAFLVEMAQDWQKLAEQPATNDNLQANPVVHEPDRGD